MNINSAKRNTSIIIFCLFIILSACTSDTTSNEESYIDLDLVETLPISRPLKINSYLDDVELMINNQNLTLGINSLELTIVNNSDTAILFGDCFGIEYWSGSYWMTLHDESKAVCILIEYTLGIGESRSSTHELSFLPENSLNSAGLYRIRKSISEYSTPNLEHDVIVEFYIR